MTVKHPEHRDPGGEAVASPKVRPDRSGPHRVELILVGHDLLRGYVADENARFLAEMLTLRGDRLSRITTVGDDETAIAEALREAFERNPHLVITTGGLGPAPDDRTLAAVGAALERPLTAHPGTRTMVEAAYQRLYRSRVIRSAGMNLAREKMTRIPVGATPVENRIGVCPGVICRLPGGAFVLCLPGKPDEARGVADEALPMLKELAPRSVVARREIESPTADEASLRALLERMVQEFPQVWMTSRPVGSGRKNARVVVALEAEAPTRQEANSALGVAVKRLLSLASGSR